MRRLQDDSKGGTPTVRLYRHADAPRALRSQPNDALATDAEMVRTI